jgi:hypothetical protein
MIGLNLVLTICMGLSFGGVTKGWVGIAFGKLLCVAVVQNSFVLSMLVHDVSFVNVQKSCCHTEQLVQWPDLILKGLAW